MKKLFACLLFYACVGAAPAWAAPVESPAARMAMAEYLTQAKIRLEQGKAEEAWQMLRSLLREDPDNIEVNVLLSQAAFATGRDNQALGAIERLVNLYPQNASLHLALAKAYARVGDEGAHAFEMAEALRLDPKIVDDEQQADLEKAARLASRRYDRFMATGRLAMGFLWDSNATSGLDSLDIEIGGYEFRLHSDSEKKAAFGEYTNGFLNWSWRLGEESPWYLTGDLAFYGKTYNRELPSNQFFTWGRASAGLRNVSANYMFDIRAKIDNAQYDPFEGTTGLGGEASFLYQLFQDFQLIVHAGAEQRTYMEYDGKNGLYWNAGLYGRYQFGGGKHSVLGGIKAINANTEEDRFSHDGFEAMLRMDFSLTSKLRFSPFGAWRQSSYHDASTSFSKYYGEDDRFDNIFIVGCGFTWSWTENIATEIGWQYINNNSTSPFYRYDQHQISTGLVFTF